ncbi:receptor-like protein kinase 5 [Setaria italica]|uniref:receptor-like protein kinase 5 n=1 Tax=Setaria italica TaxID=4555 RepID=UPI000BE5EBAF|nr:receptor-like protein kinase 5 [Setaria italica]
MEAPWRSPHLLGLVLALLPSCCLLPRAAAQDDARLLLEIKRAWGDPPVLAGWNASAAGAHCAWPYVACDTAGRVVNLTLASANVAGPFPDAVGGLTGLTYLDVSSNNITGVFPTALYRCSALQYLDLSWNHLGGELPADTGSRLGANLTTLVLSGNRFNGTIPASLSSLRNLQNLKLDDNKLIGTVPAELGKLTRLQTLWLAYNPFDAGDLPASFKNLTNMTSLWAAQCKLVGDFPRFVADMPELEVLDLSINTLTGSIPPWVWSLKKLQSFAVYRNNLTGDLVVNDFAAMGLTLIDVSENYKLTGVIPEVFGHLENLTRLSLFRNNFSGEIPASIGRLPSLSVLRLYSNRFTGILPPELGKHSTFTYMEADDNELIGTIPEGLCARGQFMTLTAKGNHLNGSIPEALANCTSLRSLQLDSNQLSGEVPQALWTIGIKTLFLRNNRLTGRLPATMDSNLTTLHIENNQLFGSIPATAAASSGGVSHALRTGLLVAGTVFLLIAAAISFFAVLVMKRRRRVAEQDDWKITPFVKDLGFGEASILRGLTEENLIGRGGSGRVYRVAYTHRRSGNAGTVAVKHIRTAGTLDENLEREFESEASILGSVRHNNIVRLLCCLTGTEARLLVYDYMDNGSLDKWLHGEGPGAVGGHLTARARRAPMDWPTRLGVAVGAAQGLCYMHHECEPPVVHRDVKTSNILLDSEFRAKVADFGLARMLAQDGAPETMSAVAGSFGYMPPECAYTKKVSEKVDVYSFGVVLLELTTGKEANDGGDHGSLAEWARHHYRSGGSIPDATDRSIRYAEYSEEVEVVFRLGVACTGDLPSSRPAMKDVLQSLLKCSDQTHQKSKTERELEYEEAPLLVPQRGSRRKQLSNGTGIDIEEKSDFDSII